MSIVQEKWDASSSYLSKKIRRIKLWQRKSSMEEYLTVEKYVEIWGEPEE